MIDTFHFLLISIIRSTVDIVAQFIVKNAYQRQLNPDEAIKLLGFVMFVTHSWFAIQLHTFRMLRRNHHTNLRIKYFTSINFFEKLLIFAPQ